jgi:hypothetical protein
MLNLLVHRVTRRLIQPRNPGVEAIKYAFQVYLHANIAPKIHIQWVSYEIHIKKYVGLQWKCTHFAHDFNQHVNLLSNSVKPRTSCYIQTVKAKALVKCLPLFVTHAPDMTIKLLEYNFCWKDITTDSQSDIQTRKNSRGLDVLRSCNTSASG